MERFESRARSRGEADAVARAELFARLSKIQRSISHRAPLQEVLDAITVGARELLGDDIVSVRLLDPDDPSHTIMASQSGLPSDAASAARRMPVGVGASGIAIAEGRLAIIEDYQSSPHANPLLVTAHVQAAMAAPVHEGGDVAGSLVVASFDARRTFTEVEQEALLAFAEHASLALMDARTVDAMREAQRAKDMFLAMVSHELKSPLTVILGTIETLRRRRHELPDELQEELLSGAHQRAAQLSGIIERLLQGARGELAAARQDVFLPDLIQSAVGGFEQSRPLHVADIPPVRLKVDVAAVRDVLGILLENAISHSPAGTNVSVETRRNYTDIEVAVSNAGSLPDDLDPKTLFMPFERGTETRSSGVGLGLYIAARLAATMGARLDVASGGGFVTFTMRMPLVESEMANAGTSSRS